MIGTTVGPYQVLGKLGEGGMGEVYRARDSRLKREVALKILPPPFARDPDRLARFQREAEALAALNHPNIASIYGLQDAGDMHALVLELVEGPTLTDLVAQRGAAEGPKLSESDVLRIAYQIAAAVSAAHDKGIVHRDLKPANIKVAPDGRVKVLDFGLAKVFAPEPTMLDVSRSPTVVGAMPGSTGGVILGTAAYMSPEQARGTPVDARTDVWAFGCVLFEMLAGRAAFSGETLTDILAAIVTSDPDWTALPPLTPPAVRRLLRRCLAKDPNDRLHAMADARLEIVEALSEPAPRTTLPPSTPSRRERAITIAAGAGIIASLAMAVPTLRYFRGTSDATADPRSEVRLEIATPPTMDPISMALSPDGRRLTFVASDNGTQRLWLRPMDSATAQPLPGTEGASYPFWSADSRSIGFAARGKLKRLDIGGGQPIELTDVAGYRGGSWNADDVIVFAAGGSIGLRRVSASGREVTQATRNTMRQTNHRFPQFLPDRRHFTFFAQGSNEGQGVFLGTLDSLESKRLMPADTAAAYLPPDKVLYVRQGALVARRLDLERGVLGDETVTVADRVGWDGAIGVGAFAASRTGVIAYRAGAPGRRQLAWFDRRGRQTSVVGSPDPNSLQYPELSRDGRRIAFDRTVLNNRDVYFLDAAGGEPTRVTLDNNVDMSPIWSPDGSRIVFGSNRSGVRNLYVKSTSFEGAETVLFDSPEGKTPNAWSPDGHNLLFVSTGQETDNDIWVLPIGSGGDSKAWPIARTTADESQATFSPNGDWIAFQSDEGGPVEIYVQPFPGPGARRTITNGGGAQPRWGRDGKEIFYLTPDDRLMAVPVRVQGANLESGTPVELFRPPLSGTAFSGIAGNIRPQYDVAPDGRFLMNVMTEETTSPITVLLNWSGLLK